MSRKNIACQFPNDKDGYCTSLEYNPEFKSINQENVELKRRLDSLETELQKTKTKLSETEIILAETETKLLDKWFYGAYSEKIKELKWWQDRVIELESFLDKAKKVVGFYGNKENYATNRSARPWNNFSILIEDTDESTANYLTMTVYSGKLARDFLKGWIK